MTSKISALELLILTSILIVIGISEYEYVVLKDHERAIFIGLWPPTMLLFLIYFNSKKKSD